MFLTFDYLIIIIYKVLQKMKLSKITIIISLILAFLLCGNVNCDVRCAENESQCYKCHTSAGNLIKITREIAETSPSKPAISSETSGEG